MPVYTLEKIGNDANGSRCTVPRNFSSIDDLSKAHENKNTFLECKEVETYSCVYNRKLSSVRFIIVWKPGQPAVIPHFVSFWGNVDADIYLLNYALSDLNGSAGRGCVGKFQI